MNIRIFDYLWFHVTGLPATTSVRLFDEPPETENSETVTKQHEDRIVKWLFCRERSANFIVKRFFENPLGVRAYFNVTAPFTQKSKMPGDLDILLVHPDRPHKVVAIEAKRVTTIATGNATAIIRGERRLARGVIQANGYHDLGFHQTFFLVVVLNDARATTTPNMLARRANSPKLERMYDYNFYEGLKSRIGVCFLDVIQLTNRDIERNGAIAMCVDNYACPIEQSADLTEKVRNFVKDSGNEYIEFPLRRNRMVP